MNFDPVRSLDDLATLNEAEMVEGYATTKRGDPEPGENRGRAFWHGWRNRMMDFGELPSDDASAQLAGEYADQQRAQQKERRDGRRPEAASGPNH